MLYAIMFILGMVLTFIQAVILSQGWTWFVVPMGVKPISVAVMFGLCTMYTVLTVKFKEKPDTTDPSELPKRVFYTSAYRVQVYIVGFVVMYITHSIVN